MQKYETWLPKVDKQKNRKTYYLGLCERWSYVAYSPIEHFWLKTVTFGLKTFNSLHSLARSHKRSSKMAWDKYVTFVILYACMIWHFRYVTKSDEIRFFFKLLPFLKWPLFVNTTSGSVCCSCKNFFLCWRKHVSNIFC